MSKQIILSIQSAVMHGSVGNEAAMPVYQHLKQPAERLDTVRLAAHPGFGTSALSVTPPEEISGLLDDYRRLASFADLAAVQTGYFGEHTQIEPVARFIAETQQAHSTFIYLLDPVLGDSGRLYVDKEILTVMRDALLPLADIITPNQFELGLLADTAITDERKAVAAARQLLNRRLQTIFITGVTTADGQIADIIVTDQAVEMITADRQANGVSGSGDVLSALFLSAVVNNTPHTEAAKAASQKTAHIIRLADTPLTMPVLRYIWEQSG